jgi:hypothetical protein
MDEADQLMPIVMRLGATQELEGDEQEDGTETGRVTQGGYPPRVPTDPEVVDKLLI